MKHQENHTRTPRRFLPRGDPVNQALFLPHLGEEPPTHPTRQNAEHDPLGGEGVVGRVNAGPTDANLLLLQILGVVGCAGGELDGKRGASVAGGVAEPIEMLLEYIGYLLWINRAGYGYKHPPGAKVRLPVIFKIVAADPFEGFAFAQRMPAEQRPIRLLCNQLLRQAVSVILNRHQFLLGELNIDTECFLGKGGCAEEFGMESHGLLKVLRKDGTGERRGFPAGSAPVRGTDHVERIRQLATGSLLRPLVERLLHEPGEAQLVSRL